MQLNAITAGGQVIPMAKNFNQLRANMMSQERLKEKDCKESLSKGLRSWRMAYGWTQHQLAAKAGVNRGIISQIEQGLKLPSFVTYCKLVKAFNRERIALLG